MRASPTSGETFAGHVIEAEVGRGGMGVVFRARNVALDRVRALKVIAPELSADPAFAARFRREARLAASIEHPNVVTVHHAGEEDGLLYIVMRYVDGVDLARLIADGPVPPGRALEILRPAATALDAAHTGGLVHRDVKPANVLIEEAEGSDHVYLTDFGISKPLSGEGRGGETATTALTGGGQVLGTADYVSPEAVEGGAVDAASDVYSFACLAYHVLTGSPPFMRGNELATLIAHTKADRPAATAINHRLPSGIDGVLREGMAIDPEERPASAGALVDRLEGELSQGRVPGHRPEDEGQRTRGLAIGGAALLLLTVAIVVAAIVFGSGGGEDEPDENDDIAVAEVLTEEIGAGAIGVAVGDVRIWVTARDAELDGADAPGGLFRLQRAQPVEAEEPLAIPEPRAVAVSPTSIWVVNGDRLFRVDPERARQVMPISVGEDPGDVAADNNYVWVVNEGDDTVSRVDQITGVVRTVEVGAEPRAIATGKGGVWVVSGGSATASRINPETMKVTAEVDVGTVPSSIAVGNKSIWVTDTGESNLYEISRSDPQAGAGPPIAVARNPRGVAVGLGAVWVASGAESVVERIDPATGELIGDPIDVGVEPADIAVGDAAVYTANFGDGTVSRIDPVE